MQGAVDTALSGQISETANLGIPSLPGDRSTASLSWQTFVAGTHSARVWVDGPQRQRFALLGELSEADVVHNGRDLWTYTSDTNTVTHSVLRTTGAATPQLPRTPAALSAQLLKAVAPSTSVGVGPSRVVAGRTAYTLVIAPRDARSTIRRIIVAVDSRRFVPLQVQIFGGSASPALRIGFTKISFTRPAASTFRFTVPRGAAVSSNPLSADRHHETANPDRRHVQSHASTASGPDTRIIGSGWTAVLELRRGAGAMVGGLPDGLGQAASTVPGSSARLLHTALVNAVITGDGRVFVGAIQPALLEHVAATTAN
jgi:outer membrane lipoprotein-sorting protein